MRYQPLETFKVTILANSLNELHQKMTDIVKDEFRHFRAVITTKIPDYTNVWEVTYSNHKL